MPTVSTAIGSIESEVIKQQGIKDLIQAASKEIMEEIALAINDCVHLQIPAEWEPQTCNVKLFKLCKQADEYNHIKSMFQSTMPMSSVVSIMCIQNIWLWERYVMTRNQMCKKNYGIVNEKFLFHGSRLCQAFDIYGSEEGFDMRFSGEGMWGLANYFAEDASYSDSYANEIGDGTKEMFVAKASTGDSCKI